MKALAIASLLLASCAVEHPVLPQPAARPCSGVCGRVTDGRGKPVARFGVTLFSADPRVGRRLMVALPHGYPLPPGPTLATKMVTSSDGWFDVDPGAADRVIVGISADGYRPAQSDVIDTALHELVGIALQPLRKIEIRVTDEAGAPLPGARLVNGREDLPLADVAAMMAAVAPLATANDSGVARIDEPVIASSTLLVTSPHHVPVQVTFAREARSLHVVLRSGVQLRGTVHDAAGHAVAAAGVEARCAGVAPLRTFARNDGSFEFEALPHEPCELVASRDVVDAPGGMSLDPIRGSASVDLRQPVEAVNLVIPPSGRLVGRLAGLDRVEEGYAAFARRGDDVVRLPTGTDGSFGRRVAPGRWEVYGSFDDPTSHLETGHVAVDAADAEEQRISAPFLNPSIVRIRFGGRPVDTGLLDLQPVDPATPTRARLVPTRPGEWPVAGLRSGTYAARIRYSEWTLVVDVAIPTDGEIDVPVSDAKIEIFDAAGRPLDADVRVTSGVSTTKGIRFETAEEHGVFPQHAVAWPLPAGRYGVRVKAEGYQDASAMITVPDGPSRFVLQTIPRPFPRPATPAALDAARVAVLAPVIRDLDERGRELWRQKGDSRRGRLVVADQTVRSPASPGFMEGRENREAAHRLERLMAQSMFQAFVDGKAVFAIPAMSGALTVPFASIPVIPPREWRHTPSEFDLFDQPAMAQKWPHSAGVALLSSPQLSRDGRQALVAAALFVPDVPQVRLYLLRGETGRWRVDESWEILTEPGC